MVNILTGTPFDTPKRLHHREDEGALEFPSSVGSRARGLLALKACNWRAARGGGWKNPYITNGLVAMWDGEWNAGGGIHDGAATVWKELISGTECESVGAPTWGEKSFRSTSNSNSAYFNSFCPDIGGASGHTVEIVSNKRTDVRGVIWGSYGIAGASGCSFEYYAGNRYFRAYYAGVPDMFGSVGTFPTGTTKYFAACRDGNAYSIKDGEGRQLASNTTTARNLKQSVMRIGVDSRTTSMGFDGDIFCIRVYNRALTAEEIHDNYLIDADRFGAA